MSGFDRAITVFSPDGQLLQVEYAQEAVKMGSPVVGVKGANVIVIAAEKRVLQKLQVERTEKKIVTLDDHIMLTFAGLRADARVLIDRARIQCQTYRLSAEEPVSIEYLARYIAHMKQTYTQSNGRRPFGICCLLAGFDDGGGLHLYQTDPSGTYYELKAGTLGRHDSSMRAYLEKYYNSDIVSTEHGTIRLAIRTLLEAMHTGQTNIDVAVLNRGQPVQMLDQETIKTFATELEKERSAVKKK